MKKVSILLTICCCWMAATLQAQDLDKATLKEWKKKQKSMDTQEFYRTMMEYNRLKRNEDMAERQVKSMSKEITDKSRRIAQLEEELKNRQGATADATPTGEGATADGAQSPERDAGQDYNQGQVFRVQIGAFRNKDLTQYTNHPRFHAETDDDGVKKYTIANFRDYWEADLFKRYLREMGVKDAWIVGYQNGKRVAIEDVLTSKDIEAIKAAEAQGGSGGW
ncbi:MAG: Ezrin/radixin/moesin family protein [Bernardetiaceae bacterium]